MSLRSLRIGLRCRLSLHQKRCFPSHSRAFHQYSSTHGSYLQISEEVKQAISERRPVVALETTIYTHGFPYPDNLSLATRLEALIRENGGVPATIGILDGIARVGFNDRDLLRLVSSAGSESTLKISRRDLAFSCALRDLNGNKFNGGTTIAGTVILAHLAGIKIFATGGLGGVHRGVEETMDISADLTELGRTPVVVIPSGCKSFLDIPKTLEFLETQGVAVATFADGRIGPVDFPAFYCRESGVRSPKVIRDELEAAHVIHAQFAFGLKSGIVFANPVPEKFSMPFAKMEAGIIEALQQAKAAGITGAAATPYILDKMKEITGKQSVVTNRALVEANVVRGARVARELCRIEEDHRASDRIAEDPMTGPAASNDFSNGVSRGVSVTSNFQIVDDANIYNDHAEVVSDLSPDVLVAGSLALDLSCDYTPRESSSSSETTGTPSLYTSNPARITQSLGGVGSNVARAAHLMGANVRLCSAVASDLPGSTAIEALAKIGLSTDGIQILSAKSGNRTAQYIAMNTANRDLFMAVADMSILESTSSGPDSIDSIFESLWLPELRKLQPKHLVLDANWSARLLPRWLNAAAEIKAHVTFEPVSNVKGSSLFKLPKPQALTAFPNHKIHLLTPNTHELAAIHSAALENGAFDRSDWWQAVDAFGIPHSGARTQLALATSNGLVDAGTPQQALQLLPFIPTICTKLGPEGVLLTQIIPAADERLQSNEHAPFILARCANDTEESVGIGGVYMRLFPAAETVKQEDIVSVNGVGDTFAGVLVAGLAKRGTGATVEDLVDLAQRAAVLTLKSKESVSHELGTLRILL